MVLKDRKHIIEILDDIHIHFSETLKSNIKGNYWPFYRIQIGYILYTILNGKYNYRNDNVKLKYAPVKYKFHDFYVLCKLLVKVILAKLKYRNRLKGKVLVFGYNDHYYQANGKSINSYLSPFITEISKKSEYEELLLFHDSAHKKETELYQLYSLIYQYQKNKLLLKDKLKKMSDGSYNNALVLNSYLSDNKIGQHEYIANVLYHGQIDLEVKTQTFLMFLKLVNPKLIWTYCFYDNATMALIRAANRLKIKNVEYQHSIQPDEHFAYAKWQNIDEYCDFFPDKFWVWQQTDKDRILKNFKGLNYSAKPIFGGNIFSLQQKEISNSIPAENKKGILITLQGEWIPEYLETIIKEDGKYRWYFRLHPRYPVDKEQLVIFKEQYSEKVEVDDANNLTVYELFRKVGFHITAASGVALEAKGFAVKNIITGEFGLSAYKNEIESGVFSYCTNKDTMLNLLYTSGDHYQNAEVDIKPERELLNREIDDLLSAG